jgi:hypothetical protein
MFYELSLSAYPALSDPDRGEVHSHVGSNTPFTLRAHSSVLYM